MLRRLADALESISNRQRQVLLAVSATLRRCAGRAPEYVADVALVRDSRCRRDVGGRAVTFP